MKEKGKTASEVLYYQDILSNDQLSLESDWNLGLTLISRYLITRRISSSKLDVGTLFLGSDSTSGHE